MHLNICVCGEVDKLPSNQTNTRNFIVIIEFPAWECSVLDPNHLTWSQLVCGVATYPE